MADQSPVMSLDDVFAQLKKQMEEAKSTRLKSVTKIRNLLDRYEKATAGAELAVIAKLMGLRAAEVEDAGSLVLDMMAALELMPEYASAMSTTPIVEEAKDIVAEISEQMAPTPHAVTADYIEVVDPRAGKLRIPKTLPHPLLAELSQTKIVVTFGGLYNLERDRWVKQQGIRHEWVDTHNSGGMDEKVNSLCKRIERGELGGVVVLNELIGLEQSRRIVAACKNSKTMMAPAKRGTQGQYKSVFAGMERQLNMG